MSTQKPRARRANSRVSNSPHVGWVIVGLATAAAILVHLALAAPGLEDAPQIAASILALDSVQRMWFITRAAGLTAYVLLWLSTAWGLVVTSKILDPLLHRSFSYDFHEYLSLLSIGFVALHVIVLLADQYLPFSLLQVLIPFIAPYRPVWVGLGVIAFYLTIVVSLTFYVRATIGSRAFRLIHYSSLVAFVGAALHGLLAGTDSSLPASLILYAGTLLSIVFLTSYWLALHVHSHLLPRRGLPPNRPG